MSKPGIYIRLPTGWIRIKEKVARPRTSKRGGSRTALTYSMVGESIDGKPYGKECKDEFIISAFKVSKYIMRIVDIVDDKAIVVIEPFSRESYNVKVCNATENILDELKRIALELKALKTRITK